MLLADPLVLPPVFDDALQDYDEFMRGDGEGVEDPEYSTTPWPQIRTAGVLHPSDSNQAYVFCGDEYVKMKVTPRTAGDITARGPKGLIFKDWPSLFRTEFAMLIDAVLPIPNNSKHMYFFSGESYALINAELGASDDAVIDGPKNITTEWAALKSAGFKTIDAVLPNPLNSEEAYFFRGDQYVLVYIQQGPNKDYIVDGPKPMWRCLKDAGFKEITMMLPNPSSSNEVFVFAKDEYALLSITHDPSDIYIVDGPKAIRTEWLSLRQARFC